jgi:transcriptional antiterminator NusG
MKAREKKTTEMMWYTIRTQGNKERKVCERIQKEPDLQKSIGQVLVPMETIVNLKNGKKVTRDKIMFPGYIFVEANSIGELKYFLRGCDGATGFLTERDGTIKPMKEKEIRRIIGQQEEQKEMDISDMFIIGEDVRITDGPFDTMIGTIEDINGDKIKVSVSIFGRKTPLELSIMQIDKKK